ncbi:MAG TPA: insulinase family protein, partial [Gemmatimonadaceae bacterium]|nr:insulinase family protein [Gemmatimonadaceae bacterium]
YLWHNYGHSTIGARSDIENVPIGRLQAFYHLYYQPDNAVLLVAGKFDPAKTLPLIEQRFGRIPKPPRDAAHHDILYGTYTVEPTQDGERSVTLRRVGDVQAVLAVYHLPALSHPDYAPLDVLASVLGNQPSGRLYQALVVPKLAADAGAFDFGRKEPGSMVVYAQVRQEGSLDSARTVMMRTLDSARTSTFSAEEVERAKTALLKDIDLALNNSTQVGLWISEWQAAGDWRLLFIHRDRLRKVTPADVQRVAAAYLKPSNATVGMFVPTPKPDRAEIPGPVDIAALVAGYKGDTGMIAGEVFDATPANIDKRLVTGTLANGMRWALLPKRTRGGMVTGRVVLRFGTAASLQGQRIAASVAAGMLDRGTAALTRQQFSDSLDHLKARLSVGGAPGRVTIAFQTVKQYVPAVMQLIADLARAPRFDAKEFEQYRQEALAGLEQSKSDPEELAAIDFARRVDPHPAADPLYTPTVDEEVAAYTAASLDQAKAFHAAFYGAQAGDLALIGDLDSAQVRAQAAKLFGDWTAQQPWSRLPHAYQAVAGSTNTIETPDKANAVFIAGLPIKVSDGDADFAALTIGNYAFGGTESSRLWMRIREKDGLSYGVYSTVSATAQDDGGRWRTWAIYAPQNAAHLQSDFDEELARALASGFTDKELAVSKSGWLQRREQARANDGELISLIVARREAGRTFAYDQRLEDAVRAATPAQVLDALKKYVVPGTLTVVKAGDFAKAKAAASTAPAAPAAPKP